MGRATYDEFAAPLHGRENYVLSTTTVALRAGFQGSPACGSSGRGTRTRHLGHRCATVYRETIGEADELLLTQILKDFDCTKFFPPYQADFELRPRAPTTTRVA